MGVSRLIFGLMMCIVSIFDNKVHLLRLHDILLYNVISCMIVIYKSRWATSLFFVVETYLIGCLSLCFCLFDTSIHLADLGWFAGVDIVQAVIIRVFGCEIRSTLVEGRWCSIGING